MTANRDRAIILFLLDTGLRASELCSLKIEGVDQKTGKVQVKHGVLGGAKGGKGRTVFLGKAARRVLWRYLAELGLDTPSSGGVFVQGTPGHALSDNCGVADLITPMAYFGQHGFDPTWPELHAIFYAAGHGIKPSTVGPIKLIDIAPTVARLLNQLATTVDGKGIDAILK